MLPYMTEETSAIKLRIVSRDHAGLSGWAQNVIIRGLISERGRQESQSEKICDGGGRRWNDVVAGCGHQSRTTGSLLVLQKAGKRILLWSLQEECSPAALWTP